MERNKPVFHLMFTGHASNPKGREQGKKTSKTVIARITPDAPAERAWSSATTLGVKTVGRHNNDVLHRYSIRASDS